MSRGRTKRVCCVVVMLALLGAALTAASRPHPTSAPATFNSITVLERSCLYPDADELDTPWTAEGPGGLRVELWCGTRLEVSGGVCRVRVGADLTGVPCRTPEDR